MMTIMAMVVKMVVMRGRSTKAVGVGVVQGKGPKHQYSVQKVEAVLEEWGRRGIVLKSDGEPALVDLKRAVRRRRVTTPRWRVAMMHRRAAANPRVAMRRTALCHLAAVLQSAPVRQLAATRRMAATQRALA